jgi:phosphatidyl-myo-inositol alpha-mannosyltransferase
MSRGAVSRERFASFAHREAPQGLPSTQGPGRLGNGQAVFAGIGSIFPAGIAFDTDGTLVVLFGADVPPVVSRANYDRISIPADHETGSFETEICLFLARRRDGASLPAGRRLGRHFTHADRSPIFKKLNRTSASNSDLGGRNDPIVVGSTPLRVCMIVGYDLSEPGGVKHHAQELAQSLRARGDQVWVVGPSSRPVGGKHLASFRGVWRAISNGSDNAFGLLVTPWQVWWFFRRHRFDVIHIHEPLLPSLAYWAIWATPSTPHIATFHAFGENRSTTLQAAARFGSRTVYPLIQRAIAVSSAAADYAAATWSRPITIIPNGVSTQFFSPAPSTSSEALRLLFVGRLSDERKGIKYLLEAFREARTSGVAATLDVVGENRGTPPVAVEGVTYHGRLALDQLLERYRACDVFVAPSTGQESFGIVLLEAMSCGKAIVCSDIDGYRTTAAHEGALLVPPRDVGALALAIETLAADPGAVRRMGEFNRTRSLAYDWASLATHLREEYLLTIARSREASEPRLLEPVIMNGSAEPTHPTAHAL